MCDMASCVIENSCFFLISGKPILLYSFRRWLLALEAQEMLDDSGSVIRF